MIFVGEVNALAPLPIVMILPSFAMSHCCIAMHTTPKFSSSRSWPWGCPIWLTRYHRPRLGTFIEDYEDYAHIVVQFLAILGRTWTHGRNILEKNLANVKYTHLGEKVNDNIHKNIVQPLGEDGNSKCFKRRWHEGRTKNWDFDVGWIAKTTGRTISQY